MRYELTDHEWTAIRPMLPNKSRGTPRVNDRRVLNGILWVLRSGAPWRDLPDAFGPYTHIEAALARERDVLTEATAQLRAQLRVAIGEMIDSWVKQRAAEEARLKPGPRRLPVAICFSHHGGCHSR